MRAAHRVIARSKPFVACFSGQTLSKKKRKAGSTVTNISVLRRRTHARTWARLPRIKEKVKPLFGAVAMSVVSACTSWQTQESTLD